MPESTDVDRFLYQNSYVLSGEMHLRPSMRDHTIARIVWEKLDEMIEAIDTAGRDVDWERFSIVGSRVDGFPVLSFRIDATGGADSVPAPVSVLDIRRPDGVTLRCPECSRTLEMPPDWQQLMNSDTLACKGYPESHDPIDMEPV